MKVGWSSSNLGGTDKLIITHCHLRWHEVGGYAFLLEVRLRLNSADLFPVLHRSFDDEQCRTILAYFHLCLCPPKKFLLYEDLLM